MEFKIENTQVYGLDFAVKASGNPMRTKLDREPLTEKDYKRASVLGQTRGGEGHDNFLKGIVVQFDINAPLYWWKQAQRYHWFDFISSQSTMHCLLKFDIAWQMVPEVDARIIDILREKIDEYGKNPSLELWRGIVASTPSGFCLAASMTTNYQQLKTMYNQRKNHKLKEWHIFCDWCLTLPYFSELVLKEN